MMGDRRFYRIGFLKGDIHGNAAISKHAESDYFSEYTVYRTSIVKFDDISPNGSVR